MPLPCSLQGHSRPYIVVAIPCLKPAYAAHPAASADLLGTHRSYWPCCAKGAMAGLCQIIDGGTNISLLHHVLHASCKC